MQRVTSIDIDQLSLYEEEKKKKKKRTGGYPLYLTRKHIWNYSGKMQVCYALQPGTAITCFRLLIFAKRKRETRKGKKNKNEKAKHESEKAKREAKVQICISSISLSKK